MFVVDRHGRNTLLHKHQV